MSLQLEQGAGLYGVFAVASAGAALTGLTGAAATYSASLFGYALAGRAYSKAAVGPVSAPTTDSANLVAGVAQPFVAQAINTAAAYVWAVDAAGLFRVYKGPTIAWTDTTASSTPCMLPVLPATVTPFAAHTIQNGASGSAFTFGTSLWNATGVSAITVRNLCQLDATPLLST